MVDPMTDIETTLIARESDSVDQYMIQPEHAVFSVSVEHGNVVCASVRLSQIDLHCLLECRVDDQPSQTVSYIRAGSVLVIKDGVEFVDVLRAAGRLRIRLSSYGQPCSFNFDLTGLDDAINRATST